MIKVEVRQGTFTRAEWSQLIAKAEAEVTEMWKPWGASLVESLWAEAEWDSSRVYHLLCAALRETEDMRHKLIESMNIEHAERSYSCGDA